VRDDGDVVGDRRRHGIVVEEHARSSGGGRDIRQFESLRADERRTVGEREEPFALEVEGGSRP
jgi:hypothetical protein